MAKPLNIIFLGISGSGKGTQIDMILPLLEKRQRNFLIAMGSIMRRLASSDTDVGTHLSEVLSHGGLAPKPLALALWLNTIAWDLHTDEGMIFDGSPRSVWEAEALDVILQFLCRQDSTRVVHIITSLEEITQRLLKRGREDDHQQAIEGRVAFFHNDVVPVVEYYRKNGMLVEINGEQAISDVHKEIVEKLKLDE